MISPYAVIAFVFGIVLSYLWLIHRFWLRGVFIEDTTPRRKETHTHQQVHADYRQASSARQPA